MVDERYMFLKFFLRLLALSLSTVFLYSASHFSRDSFTSFAIELDTKTGILPIKGYSFLQILQVNCLSLIERLALQSGQQRKETYSFLNISCYQNKIIARISLP